MLLQVFSFGNVLADLAGTVDEACCVRAQLKFTNATKVPSTVYFYINPDGNKNSSGSYDLSVAPKSVEIAPHEYQFITLTFHPRQIIPYSATFQAKVENGDGRPQTQMFTCAVQVRLRSIHCSWKLSDAVQAAFHNIQQHHKPVNQPI